MSYLINIIGQIFSAGTISKYLKNEGRKLSKETNENWNSEEEAMKYMLGNLSHVINKGVLSRELVLHLEHLFLLNHMFSTPLTQIR